MSTPASLNNTGLESLPPRAELETPRRKPLGEGIHRSGWPWVLGGMQDVAGPGELLVDDFVEATYLYARRDSTWLPDRPWVGIFHHPAQIKSPLPGDNRQTVRAVGHIKRFNEARKLLRGAIALAPCLAAELREWLKVPVLCLQHPTPLDVPQWESKLPAAQLFQTGFFLRNTRAIYQLSRPNGWSFVRSKPYAPHSWMIQRDRALKQYYHRYSYTGRIERPNNVRELVRQSNQSYDTLLAHSVVLNEIYGAGANNVVLECIARTTPILVNRLPAIEAYLGRDYPLYYDTLQQCTSMLKDEDLLMSGHAYLALHKAIHKEDYDRIAFWHDVARFTKDVVR